jgi:hypothetical protein
MNLEKVALVRVLIDSQDLIWTMRRADRNPVDRVLNDRPSFRRCHVLHDNTSYSPTRGAENLSRVSIACEDVQSGFAQRGIRAQVVDFEVHSIAHLHTTLLGDECCLNDVIDCWHCFDPDKKVV